MGDEIVKKYESGKIVNVLQFSKLDAIELFLDQLRVFEIPEEHLSIGKKLLQEDVFLCLNEALLTITKPMEFWFNATDIRAVKIAESEKKNGQELMPLDLAESLFRFMRALDFSSFFGAPRGNPTQPLFSPPMKPVKKLAAKGTPVIRGTTDCS
jgi:hypothetical protein